MSSNVVKKFLEGKCSLEEVRAILKWYDSGEADIYYSEEIEKAIRKYKEGKMPQSFDKEGIFQRIFNKIQYDSGERNIPVNKKTSQQPFLYHMLNVAASFLIFISATFIVYDYFSPTPNNNTMSSSMHLIKKSTNNGQKTTILLNDGSAINLNSASDIQYSQHFSDSSREVWLTGEAFFQIAPDPERPFIVHTKDVSTTALGTSFNIRAYDHETDILVALKTGKIKFTDNGEKSIIISNPNEGIVYNYKIKSWRNTEFDPESTFLWKDGIIYFKNVTFDEMIQRFEAWYGVKFHIENLQNADNKLFSAEFDNESLYNVLTGLSFSKDFTFSIKNDQVFIKFN